MKRIFLISALAAGLVAGCATREVGIAELQDLPFEVQQTVLEQAPGGDIAKVVRNTDHDMIVYDVTFHDSPRFPTLHIAADGTLLEHGRPIIRERAGAPHVVVPVAEPPAVYRATTDLPLAVANAIRAHAPHARIVNVNKEIRDQVIYEVELDEPGVNPALHFTEDGILVGD